MKQRLIIASTICLALFLPACRPSGSVVSNVVSPEPATAGLSPEPSRTLTQQPTETATPSPSPAFTSTATSTITPTPIAMPNLRVTYNNLEGIWFVKPPDPPVLLAANKIVDKMLLSDDGTVAVYLIDHSSFGYPDTVGAISIASGDKRDLLSKAQIAALNEESENVDLKWIPGSHRMLFTTYHFDARWGFVSDNNLFVLNLDIGGFSRIFKTGIGGDATPSPDGKRMAVARYGSLFLALIQGIIIFPDLFPSGLDGDRNNFFPQIVWTPDSSHLGIILNPYYPRETTILVVDASTGTASNRKDIANFSQGELSPTLEFVGYSLQGESPLFSYDATISKIDGSSPILLASGVSHFGSFSPDGRHFWYSIGCQKGSGDCPSDAPDMRVFIGSLDGESLPVPGFVQWVNNSQFVYVDGTSLRLGDMGGNSIEIAKADYFQSIAAKDLDFHAGEK